MVWLGGSNKNNMAGEKKKKTADETSVTDCNGDHMTEGDWMF